MLSCTASCLPVGSKGSVGHSVVTGWIMSRSCLPTLTHPERAASRSDTVSDHRGPDLQRDPPVAAPLTPGDRSDRHADPAHPQLERRQATRREKEAGPSSPVSSRTGSCSPQHPRLNYGRPTTTVDVSLTGPNGSIDLSNGLVGPGSDLWSSAVGALQRGEAEGLAGAAGGEIRLTGRVLKQIADLPDMDDWLLHRSQTSEASEVASFWSSIQDEATYRISMLEV